jgi:TRAP-type C4-dicarboxylate transport system substrate-binding protein
MPTRRHALLAALAAPALIRPASAQATQFRISTAAVEQDWLSRALLRFKAGIDQALAGQFNVSVHANGSLFRQGTEVPALQRGNLEMSTMTTFEIEQQLPQWGALSSGYGFRDYAQMRAALAGPIGAELTAAVAERMGIQIIAVIYLGTRQLMLRQAREVRTPADLSGVKLRMPPGPGWLALARGLGAAPVSMGMPEVYLAMKSGAIDGQDNPLSIARANKLEEVSQLVVLTSHLVQPVFFAIAKPFWDRMSPAQQSAIREAGRAAAQFNDDGRLAEEQEIVATFERAGLRIARPDLAPFKASVARQYEADGLAARWMPGLLSRMEAAA